MPLNKKLLAASLATAGAAYFDSENKQTIMDNQNTTGVDLYKLEALARAATPGEWKTERFTDSGHHNVYVRVSGSLVNGYTAAINTRWPSAEQSAEQESNAEFIAATNPDTVLELIAEVERLRADAERLDYLETHTVIAKHSQSIRAAIDAAIEAHNARSPSCGS